MTLRNEKRPDNSPGMLLPTSPNANGISGNVDCTNHESTLTPTQETFGELQEAYWFFNKRLFQGALPDCLITTQRCGRSFGYFCGSRFSNQTGRRTDEIALNPNYFESRGEKSVLSTLVHEMVHLSQFHQGKVGRRGYHNRQWADWMIEIGLYPSNSGEPGGRETGYQMTHYVTEGGAFDVECGQLLNDGFSFTWKQTDAAAAAPTKVRKRQAGMTDSSNRWKYTCVSCSSNVWGKPKQKIICEAVSRRCISPTIQTNFN